MTGTGCHAQPLTLEPQPKCAGSAFFFPILYAPIAEKIPHRAPHVTTCRPPSVVVPHVTLINRPTCLYRSTGSLTALRNYTSTGATSSDPPLRPKSSRVLLLQPCTHVLQSTIPGRPVSGVRDLDCCPSMYCLLPAEFVLFIGRHRACA